MSPGSSLQADLNHCRAGSEIHFSIKGQYNNVFNFLKDEATEESLHALKNYEESKQDKVTSNLLGKQGILVTC